MAHLYSLLGWQLLFVLLNVTQLWMAFSLESVSFAHSVSLPLFSVANIKLVRQARVKEIKNTVHLWMEGTRNKL